MTPIYFREESGEKASSDVAEDLSSQNTYRFRPMRGSSPTRQGSNRPSLSDIILRVAIGLAATAAAFALWRHRSGQADLFGRYSLEYSLLLAAYLPLLGAACFIAVGGGRLAHALPGFLRSRPVWVLAVTLLLLEGWLGVRLVRMDDPLDRLRMVALFFLGGACLLALAGIAGRSGETALRRAATNTVLAGAAVATVAILGSVLLVLRPGAAQIVSVDEARRVIDSARMPHAEFVYRGQVGQPIEFSVPIRNNALGYRDRERTFENPRGRFRILVLGDSFVEAYQVPLEQSLSSILQRLLGDSVEVIALGRSGVGQREELAAFEEIGRRFSPNLVVLLFVINDLYDNDSSLYERYVQYVRTWTPNPPRPRALLFPELPFDRFVTGLLHRVLVKYGYLISRNLALATLRPDYGIYLNPQPGEIRHARDITEGLLAGIQKAVEREGAHLVLVLHPIMTDRERLVRSHPWLGTVTVDPEGLSRWLARYAREHALAFLDLDSAFRAHLRAGGDRTEWRYDGHWTETGHRVAAEAILRFLQSGRLVPRIGTAAR